MAPNIRISSFHFDSYAFMVVTGFLAASILLMFVRKKYDISARMFIPLLGLIVAGVFIGAKAAYVIINPYVIIYLTKNISFFIHNGFVFYGGLCGGMLAVLLFARISSISAIKMLDTLAPCAALGHAFGRVGCYLAGCCYGCQASGTIGVIFPGQSIARVPIQLYEASFLLLLCITLIFILFRTKHPGLTSSFYCILYSIWRFIAEFYRGDFRGSIGMLSTSQFISIFLFVLGVYLLFKAYRSSIMYQQASSTRS